MRTGHPTPRGTKVPTPTKRNTQLTKATRQQTPPTLYTSTKQTTQSKYQRHQNKARLAKLGQTQARLGTDSCPRGTTGCLTMFNCRQTSQTA